MEQEEVTGKEEGQKVIGQEEVTGNGTGHGTGGGHGTEGHGTGRGHGTRSPLYKGQKTMFTLVTS